MKRRSLLLLALSTLSLPSSLTAAEDAAPKHVVIVVGTHHYSPNKSMPLFAERLESLGLRTTVLNPAWNPEKGDKGIPGLAALADADLALFFTRFLQLEDAQLRAITDYLSSGKPVVGLRTSTHGFNYPTDHPHVEWNNRFGADALGTRYLIHLAGATQLQVIPEAQEHPILTGLDATAEWTSPGTLYLTDFPSEGITPLVRGTGQAKRTGQVKNQFGTHQLEKEMTDVIAWTWTNKWGGKTFSSSLGHPGDFAVEPSLRLMINGVFWALGEDIPSSKQAIETFTLAKKKK